MSDYYFSSCDYSNESQSNFSNSDVSNFSNSNVSDFSNSSASDFSNDFSSSNQDNFSCCDVSIEERTQLSIIINEIKKYYNADKQRGNNYKPHIVFQPPLPKRVIYKNGSVIDIDKDKNYIGKERI